MGIAKKTAWFSVALLVLCIVIVGASWVSVLWRSPIESTQATSTREERVFCTLWTNRSVIDGSALKVLIARFYDRAMAKQDCELLRKQWDDGHSPVCDCKLSP